MVQWGILGGAGGQLQVCWWEWNVCPTAQLVAFCPGGIQAAVAPCLCNFRYHCPCWASSGIPLWVLSQQLSTNASTCTEKGDNVSLPNCQSRLVFCFFLTFQVAHSVNCASCAIVQHRLRSSIMPFTLFMTDFISFIICLAITIFDFFHHMLQCLSRDSLRSPQVSRCTSADSLGRHRFVRWHRDSLCLLPKSPCSS